MGTQAGKAESHYPALGQTQALGQPPTSSPMAHTGPLPGHPYRQTYGGLWVTSPELTSLGKFPKHIPL